MNIHPKVQAAGVGGALATLIVWGFSLAGVTVPTDVGMAIATIAAVVAGYFVSDK